MYIYLRDIAYFGVSWKAGISRLDTVHPAVLVDVFLERVAKMRTKRTSNCNTCSREKKQQEIYLIAVEDLRLMQVLYDVHATASACRIPGSLLEHLLSIPMGCSRVYPPERLKISLSTLAESFAIMCCPMENTSLTKARIAAGQCACRALLAPSVLVLL